MKYLSDNDDPVLIKLHGQGLTDSQIAMRMKFSRPTICQRRIKLGLEPNYDTRGAKLLRDEQPKPPKHVPSPVEVAKAVFGRRLTERNGAYWLDGRPVNTANMVREANRIRLNRGEEQVGPDGWRV